MTQQEAIKTNPAEAGHAASHPVHTKRSMIADGFKSRTKGEGEFNFGTYVLSGFVGVTALSVLMTYLFRDTKGIAPWYNRQISNIIEITKGARTGEALERYSTKVNSFMTIATLFTGGTVASVAATKVLEDNKGKIVQWRDEQIYGKEAVENDPKLIQAHQEMLAVPQQTWLSIFLSRCLAFGATLAVFLAMGSNKSPVARHTNHSIDELSIRLGRGLDRVIHSTNQPKLDQIAAAKNVSIRGSNKPFPMTELVRAGDTIHGVKVQPHEADRLSSRIFSYIGLDGFYTLITSALLFTCTRILAPFFDKHVQMNATEAAPTPAPVHAAAPPEQPAPRRGTPIVGVQGIQAQGRLQERSAHALDVTHTPVRA